MIITGRRLAVILGTLAFILVIFAAELSAPSDVRLGMFYLVPVLVATWFEGVFWGAICVVATVVLRMALEATQGLATPGLSALHQAPFILVAGITMFGFRHMKRTQDALQRLATHDHLTNVLNAGEFTSRVTQELQRQRRYRRPSALLYLDLDNFKGLNDTHGHQTGDAVLRLVADAIRRTVREVDVVGRMGGDEFAVLMPETDSAVAAAAAHRLGDSVRTAFNGTPPVTASVGVVSFDETTGSAAEVLRRADQAMYEAKRMGKDQVVQVNL